MNAIAWGLLLVLFGPGTLKHYRVGPLSLTARGPVTITEFPDMAGDQSGLFESFTLKLGQGAEKVTVAISMVKRGSTLAQGAGVPALARESIAAMKADPDGLSETKAITLADSHLRGVYLIGRSAKRRTVHTIFAYDENALLNIGWGSATDEAAMSKALFDIANSMQISSK